MKNRTYFIGLENVIYLLIWLVVFIIPIFGFQTDSGIQWTEVKRMWIKVIPFLLLFILQNYVFIPLLLSKKRYLWYLVSTIALIALIFTATPLTIREMADPPPFENQRETGPGPSPGHDFPPPYPGEKNSEKSQFPPHRPMPIKWGPMLNGWLMAILLVGFNIAIQLIFKSARDSRRLKELESQTLRAELNYLRAQINPHFFMNTLNNIHALIDLDTEQAKNVIIELSKLMRYLLYEADKQSIPLSREIEFINNFTALMRIRYSDELEIKITYPDNIPTVSIPPLLFLPLMENAFKHGNATEGSFIRAKLIITDKHIIYSVCNSITINIPHEPGVGLKNLRQRLELIYGEKYALNCNLKENEYITELMIPVQL